MSDRAHMFVVGWMCCQVTGGAYLMFSALYGFPQRGAIVVGDMALIIVVILVDKWARKRSSTKTVVENVPAQRGLPGRPKADPNLPGVLPREGA